VRFWRRGAAGLSRKKEHAYWKQQFDQPSSGIAMWNGASRRCGIPKSHCQKRDSSVGSGGHGQLGQSDHDDLEHLHE
jgi:hypothetical protein